MNPDQWQMGTKASAPVTLTPNFDKVIITFLLVFIWFSNNTDLYTTIPTISTLQICPCLLYCKTFYMWHVCSVQNLVWHVSIDSGRRKGFAQSVFIEQSIRFWKCDVLIQYSISTHLHVIERCVSFVRWNDFKPLHRGYKCILVNVVLSLDHLS